MELSENPHVDILRFAKIKEAKARYDRYVCAVASAGMTQQTLNGLHTFTTDELANDAMNLMLAADKRWEEYVKGEQDETH